MNPSEDSRRAGRGLVSIAGAKGYFIVTSYAVQLLLPRIFGEAKEFGLYSATMSGVAILTNVLIVATIQSVSKFVSEDESRAEVTLRQGLRVQTLVGGILALALFVFAPAIARLLLDDQLTRLLRVASVVVFAYALYAAVVGSLNGRHWFSKQARLDFTFSTLRTVGILAGAALGFGAIGAVAGFATASATILSISLIWIGFGKRGEPIPLRRWIGFMAPIWTYQLCLNGILMIDLQVLKRTATEIAFASTATSQAAVDLANQYVGYYRAAQTFAFVPYQLIISLTFVVFPMISKATSIGNREAAQSTVQHAMRLSLLLLLLVAAPTSGAAHGVMQLAYPAEYLTGAPALSILVFGVAAFALFAVAATAISGAGQPSLAAIIAGVSLLAVAVANRVLVMRTGLGEGTLVAAATGTTIGMVIALILSAWVIYKLFGVFIPVATWLRAALAAGVGYATATATPHDSPVMALAALAVGFTSSLAVLVVTRELTRDDWHALRRIVRRD
ncbi:MAG: lipopolysaccharide biosynthesis protein [Deltaproteobacteria bacterium]|nr:lipopolysaccharide biosynthesis protein [Deltaproteobacteria bacterium]MBW1875974.1 lipopolysaccharide biosynthesis protein [Deltaproteobacteria bacterium]MBW2549536.1 lipopolysaccharide biosynthesis protein [Deltaproteobacteria bacterium]MBW2627433.1 lipopolysaccharide biosynthesis protein [Deltaproteobacteria bacterium]